MGKYNALVDFVGEEDEAVGDAEVADGSEFRDAEDFS